MGTRYRLIACRWPRIGWVLLLALVLGPAARLHGQLNGGAYDPYRRSVGGVSINADGLLDNASMDLLGKLAKERAAAMAAVPGQMKGPVELRKISLRGLEAQIDECLKNGKKLPQDVIYLGGLQEIRYIFVYPEQGDIVLVGSAEGWKVDAKGNMVGITTRKPVMLLDDLLVALRTARDAAQGGITCSIDPTKDGLQRFSAYRAKLKQMGNPETIKANMEQALGPQQITFSGVPATTHFARVLIAADYRMKRMAMNFEPSPLPRELPSFLHMLGSRVVSNMLPRWWLEPKFDALVRDAEGLAWELQGASVKCVTEEDFIVANGNRQHSGKANPIAQKWADKMTEHYDRLAIAEPIFGELRNCMQLALLGALVARENLTDKANCSLPILLGSSALKIEEFTAPTQVDSKVTMLKQGQNWQISASGGVCIYPWSLIEKAQKDEAPKAVRAKAAPADGSKWCWN